MSSNIKCLFLCLFSCIFKKYYLYSMFLSYISRNSLGKRRETGKNITSICLLVFGCDLFLAFSSSDSRFFYCSSSSTNFSLFSRSFRLPSWLYSPPPPPLLTSLFVTDVYQNIYSIPEFPMLVLIYLVLAILSSLFDRHVTGEKKMMMMEEGDEKKKNRTLSKYQMILSSFFSHELHLCSLFAS